MIEEDNSSDIVLILREHADFFSSDDIELFHDDDMQYELLIELMKERGKIVCSIDWDSGVMAGETTMRRLDDFYIVNDDIEPFYGHFNSFDAAINDYNGCRYISNAVRNIYIDKDVDSVEWIIVTDEGYTLMINGIEYVVQNERLVKVR